MKLRILLLSAALLVVGVWPASAQTTIDNTNFSSAVNATQTTVSISSATCTNCTFGNGTWLYVDEEVLVVAPSYTSGTSNIPVLRGRANTFPAAHTTSAKVFVGPPQRFRVVDPPAGACNKVAEAYYPWINVASGYRWLCDNGQNANTAVVWRAAVPWGLTASSDAVGALHLPAFYEQKPTSVIARLEAALDRFFAW